MKVCALLLASLCWISHSVRNVVIFGRTGSKKESLINYLRQNRDVSLGGTAEVTPYPLAGTDIVLWDTPDIFADQPGRKSNTEVLKSIVDTVKNVTRIIIVLDAYYYGDDFRFEESRMIWFLHSALGDAVYERTFQAVSMEALYGQLELDETEWLIRNVRESRFGTISVNQMKIPKQSLIDDLNGITGSVPLALNLESSFEDINRPLGEMQQEHRGIIHELRKTQRELREMKNAEKAKSEASSESEDKRATNARSQNQKKTKKVQGVKHT